MSTAYVQINMHLGHEKGLAGIKDIHSHFVKGKKDLRVMVDKTARKVFVHS